MGLLSLWSGCEECSGDNTIVWCSGCRRGRGWEENLKLVREGRLIRGFRDGFQPLQQIVQEGTKEEGSEGKIEPLRLLLLKFVQVLGFLLEEFYQRHRGLLLEEHGEVVLAPLYSHLILVSQKKAPYHPAKSLETLLRLTLLCHAPSRWRSLRQSLCTPLASFSPVEATFEDGRWNFAIGKPPTYLVFLRHH